MEGPIGSAEEDLQTVPPIASPEPIAIVGMGQHCIDTSCMDEVDSSQDVAYLGVSINRLTFGDS
jgi:hypothetical protein